MSLRSTAVLTVLLAVVLVPGAAHAKGLASAQACGAEGCADVLRRTTHWAIGDGAPSPAPRRKAPFYELRFGFGDPSTGEVAHSTRRTFIPSARLLLGDDGSWSRPRGRTLRALRRMVRGVTPYQAAALDLTARRRRTETEYQLQGPPGPMNLRTPGGGDGAAAAGDGGGLGAAPAAGIGIALLLAVAGASVLTTARRRRAAPPA